MSRNGWLIGIAGILCFASGCSSKTASKQPSSPNTVAVVPSTASSDQASPLTAKDFFPEPLVAGSTTIKPLPIPNLIPPTTSVERVPQINAGRPDPFASLNLTPTVSQKQQSVSRSTAITVPATVPQTPTVTVSTLPPPSLTSLGPLPTLLPAGSSLNSLPPLNVPHQITPQRSLAESIEISGVVAVGGKTNVIVQVPNEQTSRYVTVGEKLANGQVLVKRVEMGAEPVVILEQGGREVIRSVGSSSALIGSL